MMARSRSKTQEFFLKADHMQHFNCFSSLSNSGLVCKNKCINLCDILDSSNANSILIESPRVTGHKQT